MSEKNEPAFPCPMGGDWPECDRGMTLRDYFAAHALQGMLANYEGWAYTEGYLIANASYRYADAMMKARNQ